MSHQTIIDSSRNTAHLTTPVATTDAQKVSPQSVSANPGAIGKGVSSAGAPTTASAMILLQQGLEQSGLVDPTTGRDPRSTTVHLQEEGASPSQDSPPQSPFATPVISTNLMLQSMNNQSHEKMVTATDIQVESGDGMPEGTYAALAFAYQVSASAISQVSAIIGGNSAKIAELNTLIGVSATDIYETQLKQQQENVEKQNDKSHLGKVFGKIGHIAGDIAAAAIIVGGIITCDPAMVVGGMFILAMSNSFISSHLTNAIAAGLNQIPGMPPEVAHGIAEGIVIASTVLVMVVSCNGAGATAEIGEAAKGAATVVETTEEGTEMTTFAAEGIETVGEVGGEVGNVGAQATAQIQSEVLQEGVQAGEKSLGDTLTEMRTQLTTFLQSFGSDPMAQKALQAVKVVSGLMMATGSIGEAVVSGEMARLTKQNAVMQATLEWVQSGLESVDMRNQLNTSLLKDVTQANIKEIIAMYNAQASAIGSIAQNMYQA